MKSVAAYLLSLFFVLLGFNVQAAKLNCQQQQCMAIVDAGSTGSRLHIYSFDVDKTNTPVNIKELWSKKIKPGLATLELTQASIDQYLLSLFEGAPAANLPVYFYATAGMRLLPQPKQKQFFSLLQKWFAIHSQWHLKAAKTITGTEEGVFGWLAVNYQLGTLSLTEKNPVGVMDMGGASVQITFPVERLEGAKATDIQEINLYGRHFKLYTHSFLGLGQTVTSQQFLDVSSCFANNYELPTGFPAEGDAYFCKGEIGFLINNVHHVDFIVQPVMQANPIAKWVVLGGMAELAQSKPFQFSDHQFTNEALLEQANAQICHQQWSTLSALYPSNEYLYGYCLFPSYYYALMVEGYGLQPQQEVNYLASNQSGDWTLGVVLHR